MAKLLQPGEEPQQCKDHHQSHYYDHQPIDLLYYKTDARTLSKLAGHGVFQHNRDVQGNS